MPENRSILIGVAVVAVAAVGLLLAALWPSANNETFPNGLDYLCPNGHGFTMTVKQVDQFCQDHYGDPMPCPTCKATPCRRAVRDVATGKFHVPDRNEGALTVPGQRPPPEAQSVESSGRRSSNR